MNPIDLLHERISVAGLWSKQVSLKRNEFLKVKGSTDTNVYFVQEGSLRIFIEDEYEEHTIRFAYPGSVFVALDSFFTGQPSPFYMQALKKCEIKVLKKNDLTSLVKAQPELNELWKQMLEVLVVQQLEREIDLLTHSPAERYRRVRERSPHLFQEIPAKYIANYLRMTPETLSRLKKS